MHRHVSVFLPLEGKEEGDTGTEDPRMDVLSGEANAAVKLEAGGWVVIICEQKSEVHHGWVENRAGAFSVPRARGSHAIIS